MSEEELAEMSERFAITLRHAGLVGHDLDCALAGCIMSASYALETQRLGRDKRRSAIRLVDDDYCDGAA